jgi:hypothetical protein
MKIPYKMPYIAVGNGDLEKNEDVGDTILCPRCKKHHKIEHGEEVLKDGTRKPSRILALYRCKGKSYLAGIGGKLI